MGFPGGGSVKNLSASASDTGDESFKKAERLLNPLSCSASGTLEASFSAGLTVLQLSFVWLYFLIVIILESTI